VEEIVRGLRKDRFEIRIGRVKGLVVLGRLAPSLADAIVARATEVPAHANEPKVPA
jgi:hypothetical protein